MPGAYSTFDTLSLELGDSDPFGLVNSGGSLPVLARIPRIEIEGSGATHSHVEAAHEVIPPPKMQAVNIADSFFAIDTLTTETPSLAIQSQPTAKQTQLTAPPVYAPAPAPAPAPAQSTETVLLSPAVEQPAATRDRVDTEEDWPSALLQLEAAIAPYSQLIVLLTLIIAAGLTMLLFRTQPVKLDDGADQPANNASTIAATTEAPAFVAPDPQASQTKDAAQVASQPTVLQVQQPSAPVLQPPISARGPAGIASVTPVQPHRESAQAQTSPNARVAQADAPGAGYPTTDDSQRPMARLSNRVLPYQQQAK